MESSYERFLERLVLEPGVDESHTTDCRTPVCETVGKREGVDRFDG